MKLTFIGAAHEVTGSCTLLQIGGRHMLIDCGMEQGTNIYENEPLPVAEAEIDCVFVRLTEGIPCEKKAAQEACGGTEGSFGLWTAFEGCADAG